MAQPAKQIFSFVLDGINLAVFMSLVATGFAMEFTMRGRGVQQTQLGLTRHDVSEIHLWLGIAFLVLGLLHLAVHWRWIWMFAKGQNPKTQTARAIAFLITMIVLLSIALLPWIAPVRPVTGVGENQPALVSPTGK